MSALTLIALSLPAFAGSVPASELAAAATSLPADVCVEDGTPAAILADGAVLLDDRRDVAERVAAATSLGARGDVRALPILRAGARDRDPAVQLAALDAAAGYADVEGVAIVEWVLHDGRTPYDVRVHAVDALGGIGREEAGHALWSAAGDRSMPGPLRNASRRELEARYPDVLAVLGAPKVVSDVGGAALAVTGHGVLGGVLFSSVGTWGKFQAAPAIGGAGGALIGVSTGALYTIGHPVTLGDGLAYASGVGWGLAGGVMFTESVVGPPPVRGEPQEKAESRADAGAAARSVGVLAGAGLAGWDLRNDPRPQDVLEVDLAGYLGSALVLGVSDLAAGPERRNVYDWDPYATEEDYWAYEDWKRDDHRRKAGSNLAGAALGLAAGAALAKPWQLDPEDAAFAAAVGPEAAWIGAFWPTAVGVDDTRLRGTIRVPLHAAIVGSLVLSELHPIPPLSSAVGAYGAVMGNALGAGVPMLADAGDKPLAQFMLPLGVAGMTTGVVGAPWLAPKAGDWTMVGVGTSIAFAEGAVVANWLDTHGALHGRQPAGLALTTGSAVGTGLMIAGRWVDPKPADALFLGSAAVWGAWYGGMVPVAGDWTVRGSDAELSGALTADVFLGAGALLLGPGHVDPRRTLLAQTAGLSGATVGALATAMFTDDGRDVAWGALAGSTAGLAGGAAWTAFAPGKHSGDVAFLPRVDVPGVWAPLASPVVGEDGSVGMQVGVTAVGW